MPPKTKATRKAPAKGRAVQKQSDAGRRLILTEEMRKEIEECLILGNSHKTAYTLAGIARSTFYLWLKLGEEAAAKLEKGEQLTENEQSYMEFSDIIKRATEKGKKRHLSIINQVAQGALIKETEYVNEEGEVYKVDKVFAPPNWQASAWTLERRYPEEYGRKDKMNVDQKISGTLVTENKQVEELIASLPEEELLRIVRDAKRDDAESPADDKELLN